MVKMKKITIKDKGDFDLILFHPAEKDGLVIFMGSRGNGLEDMTDVDFTEIPWGEVEIQKLHNRLYELTPRPGPVRNNGGSVRVRGEKYPAAFYCPVKDALFSDKMRDYMYLGPIGELTDLETDGIRARKAVTDTRLEKPLFEFYAEA